MFMSDDSARASSPARWSRVLAALALLAVTACKSSEATAPDAGPDTSMSQVPDGPMSDAMDGPTSEVSDATRMDVPCGPMGDSFHLREGRSGQSMRQAVRGLSHLRERQLGMCARRHLRVGCNNFGLMLEGGAGVPADKERAMRLLETACNLGEGNACANLGARYHSGTNVPRDVRRARELLGKACRAGVPQACVDIPGE